MKLLRTSNRERVVGRHPQLADLKLQATHHRARQLGRPIRIAPANVRTEELTDFHPDGHPIHRSTQLPPAALENLIATQGNHSAILTWSASLAATAYQVIRALVSGGPYTTIRNVSTSGYVNPTQVNGTTYDNIILVNDPTGNIRPAEAVVSLSGLQHSYDGFSKPVTVVTSPDGLEFEVTYDGAALPPSELESYKINAEVSDPI